MHRDLCKNKSGLCDEMKPTKGEELLKYLKKVDFEGKSKNFISISFIYLLWRDCLSASKYY